MLRRWKPALVILGSCAAVIAAAGYVLTKQVGDAINKGYFPPPRGAAYVYSPESDRLEKVWTHATFEVAWSDGERIWVTDADQPGHNDRTVHEINVVTGKSTKVFKVGSGGYVSLLPSAGMVAFVKGDAPPLEVNVWTTDGARLSFGEGDRPVLTGNGSQIRFSRPSCSRRSSRPTPWIRDPNT